MIKDEKNITGIIGLSYFIKYFSYGTYLYFFFCCLIVMISVAIRIFANYWIGAWKLDKFNLSDNEYIIRYIIIDFTALVFIILRGLFFGHYISIVSYKIFWEFIDKLLVKSMLFFDITPMG